MPAANTSQEISHLVRDKGYPQKRAVAAALSMERRGDFRKGGRKGARRSSKSRKGTRS